eukprot:CAMPEP_0202355650 /NCGR_PEP_ID=MMETSP1126-20121109/10453_1 /ASSEMBLY_ACC=CAM_ASM_000457 /TAXON_ID=3047 /ORGANISM="Dunaliella tertiolecta, Strain CCMP1320" /LENGTH=301 /DNA_ID=CAMNT_0048948295 /DNA_START=238 /DNA_END=1143 /DNA_ORIENTATION=-
MAAPEAAGQQQDVASTSSDLLVYGPGVLGSYAGHLWKERMPGARVLGLTNTSNNHDRLQKMGLETATKDSLAPGKKYAHVLFSAPPSGSEDYVAEVKRALELWDPSHPSSSFVFTGSMSVCSVDDGGEVSDEHCPLHDLGKAPNVDRLLLAEQAVLQAGGNVIRLVGLYHTQRGAHTFFLRAKEIQRPGGYVVNLLHYEDAARLATSVLAGDGSGPFRGRAFLGCDNHPITFREMVLACTQSGVFEGEVKWLVPDGERTTGKRCNNDGTRAALGGWTPKYSSFAEFMHSGGRDYYNTCGLF